MKKISLIIPIFCNEGSLKSLFKDLKMLKKKLIKKKILIQIIAVDDNSTDNSFNILKNLFLEFNNIVLIKHLKNLGSWNALRTGMNFVEGDAFTYLSADRQEPINLVEKMYTKWKQGNKIVIAERKNRIDPFIKTFFSYIFSLLVRKFFFKNYPRNNFDVAFIDSKYLPFFKSGLAISYIPFEIFLLTNCPAKIQYIRQARKYGKSKFTLIKKLEIVFEIFFSYTQISIRLILFCGIILALTSFFYMGFIIFYNMLNPIEVRGFPATIAILTLFFSIILLFLAISMEYILRIYNENKNNRQINYKLFIDEIFKR